MAEHQAPPSVEQSMKYMAWNVKQMDENIKKIANCMAELIEMMKNQRRSSSSSVQEEMPF